MTKASKIVTTVPEIKKKTVSKVEAWVTKADLTDHITNQEMVVVDLTNSTIERKDHNKITVVDHMTTSLGTAVTNLETDFQDSMTVTTIKEDSLILIREIREIRETKNFTVVRLALTTTEMMMVVVVVATSESKEEVDPVNLKEAHLDNFGIVKTALNMIDRIDLISAIDLNTVETHEVKQLLLSQRLF